MLKQISPNLIRVRTFAVDLIDRDDHRHFGCFCMRNRLNRLRHHSVIRSNNQNNNVSHLSTARTHRRKRRVTRSIEKRQELACVSCDLIRTDVLRNSTGLASNDTCFTDSIQKGCLTVINMAHDRNDRSTRFQIFEFIFDLCNHMFNVSVGNANNFVTKLFDNQFRSIGVNRIRLHGHDAVVHQRLHNLRDLFRHPDRKLCNGNRLW